MDKSARFSIELFLDFSIFSPRNGDFLKLAKLYEWLVIFGAIRLGNFVPNLPQKPLFGSCVLGNFLLLFLAYDLLPVAALLHQSLT